MEGLGVAANVIAVIDLSAKVTSACAAYLKAVKNAKTDIGRLQSELRNLDAVLHGAEKLVKGPASSKLQTMGQLKAALSDASSQLQQLITKLDGKQGKTRKAMSHFGFRALKWPFESSEVESIIQGLEKNRNNISVALVIDNTALHIETHSNVQHISSGVQHLSLSVQYIGRTLDMSKIPVAEGAAFDSYTNGHDPQCLPNTRVELLQTITTWAEDPDSDPIFWLNGMAGTGKSTISRTIAHSFAEKKMLGASFFFKRGEKDRGNGSRLFTTVAAQLIIRLPEIAQLVIKAIEDEPDLPNKFIQEQFEKLILHPLQELDSSISSPRVLALVVDALDECDQGDARLIINILASLRPLTSIKLKAFVTSRPDLPIRLGFRDIQGQYKDKVLHEIPEPVIEHDISEFLHHQLEKTRLEYNCQSDPNDQLGPDWPGTQVTDELIKMAIPLFIFAATMCRFIQDPFYDPVTQLDKVMKYKFSSQDSNMKKLDTTYRPTLDQLLIGRTEGEKETILKDFRDVVGVIVLLAEPLSVMTLSCLVDKSERAINGILRPLHSVLEVPISSQEPVRVFHLSFHDFLIDREMHNTDPFWVDAQATHGNIAAKCLDLLRSGKHLKQDICDLGWPGAQRRDIEQGHINLKLPSQVQYACLYWAHHLIESGLQITDSHPAFSFLNESFIFWLEALAILGEAHKCSSMITALLSLVDTKDGIGLSTFLRDAAQFVTRVDSVIDERPLQIYASGLVFAPEESIVRTNFRKCIPKWITQPPQIPQSWDGTLRIIEASLDIPTEICFLPDSRTLQTVSEDGVVQIWDSMTGKQIDSIKPAGGRNVYFSLDGQCTLSTSANGDVLFWSSLTTSSSLQFRLPIGNITLSSDGRRAACVARNAPVVIVFDLPEGRIRRQYYGDKGENLAVTLSPDGELLAITRGNIVQLWNVNSGSKTWELSGAESEPNFSLDSRLIAFVGQRYVVVVHDARTGRVVQHLQGHTALVSSVAFKSDGKQVATASHDNTIRLWDLDAGRETHRFEHDCNAIIHLIFSPDDGLLAASSSDDNTILLLDPKSTVKNDKNDSNGHGSAIYRLALSREAKHVASIDDASNLDLWDLETGHKIDAIRISNEQWCWVSFSPAQENLIWLVSFRGSVHCYDTLTKDMDKLCDGHFGQDVSSVTISPDGSTIALQLTKSVHIWDLVTKTMQHVLTVETEDESEDETEEETEEEIQEEIREDIEDETKEETEEETEEETDEEAEDETEDGTFQCIAFSTDSKMLASITACNEVIAWDLKSGCIQQWLDLLDCYWEVDGTPTALSLHDSVLALSSRSGRLSFWHAMTEDHLGSVQADGCFRRLKFDPDGTCLITNRGDIRIPPLHGNDFDFDEPWPFQELEGYGFTEKCEWITWKSKPFMWLPRSHRPAPPYSDAGTSLVVGSTAILGSMCGRVSILKFVEVPPWASQGRPGSQTSSGE